jgi:ABC-2 type transport system ATP-binding protein
MRDRGAAIIMSTHQMHQVEEMCERILLIDHGERVLYGRLEDIRQQYATNAVEVDLQGALEAVPGVEQLTPRNGGYRMVLQKGAESGDVLQVLVNMPDVTVERFERVQVSLDDIFVQAVSNGEESR